MEPWGPLVVKQGPQTSGPVGELLQAGATILPHLCPIPHAGPHCESALMYVFPWVSPHREKAEAGEASPEVSQEP